VYRGSRGEPLNSSRIDGRDSHKSGLFRKEESKDSAEALLWLWNTTRQDAAGLTGEDNGRKKMGRGRLKVGRQQALS